MRKKKETDFRQKKKNIIIEDQGISNSKAHWYFWGNSWIFKHNI